MGATGNGVANKFQSVRGFNDVLPADAAARRA